MSDSGFEDPLIPPLSTGTPSMTYSGSLLAFSEELPRMRTVVAAPGAPPPVVMLTPATLPWMSCSGLVIWPGTNCLASTVVTAPVMSWRRWVP